MAMRREVVSLSQLLQRPKTSATQPTGDGRNGTNANGLWSSANSSYLRSTIVQAGARAQSSVSTGKSQTFPNHRGGGQDGGIHHLMQSQTDNSWQRGGSMSQSMDGCDEAASACQTSQSQSQTCFSQSQPTYMTQEEMRPPPAPAQSHHVFHQSSYSRLLLESGKLALEAAKEKARGEEELLTRLAAPVEDRLKELQAAAAAQANVQDKQTAMLVELSANMKSLRTLLDEMHSQNNEVKAHCDECYQKITHEAGTVRKGFEGMSSKLGVIEMNVDSFITNMTMFVREELVSLQFHRDGYRRSSSPLSERHHMKFETQSPVDYKHYGKLLCDRSPPEETSVRKELRSSNAQVRGRHELLKKKGKKSTKARDATSVEVEDAYGLQMALEKIERARAKRRRQ